MWHKRHGSTGSEHLVSLFINSFPVLLLIGVWVYFSARFRVARVAVGAMSFGRAAPGCLARIR